MSTRNFPAPYVRVLSCDLVDPGRICNPFVNTPTPDVAYRFCDPVRYMWFMKSPALVLPHRADATHPTEAICGFDLPEPVTSVDVYVRSATMPQALGTGPSPLALSGFTFEAYAGIGSATSRTFVQNFNPQDGGISGGPSSSHGRLFSFGGAAFTRLELYAGTYENLNFPGVAPQQVNFDLMFIAQTSGPIAPFTSLGDFSPP